MGCGSSRPDASSQQARTPGDYAVVTTPEAEETVVVPEKPPLPEAFARLEYVESVARIDLLEEYWRGVVAAHPFTVGTVARHSESSSLWVILHGRVFDMTTWQEDHPGGPKSIQQYGGKDGTKAFDKMHSKTTKAKVSSHHRFYLGALLDERVAPGAAVGSAFESCFQLLPPVEGEDVPPAATAPSPAPDAFSVLAHDERVTRIALLEEYWRGVVDVHPFTQEKVALHAASPSLWVILYGRVFDMTTWQDAHPGGAKSIQVVGGKDATEEFIRMHDQESYAAMTTRHSMYIGTVLKATCVPGTAIGLGFAECFESTGEGVPQRAEQDNSEGYTVREPAEHSATVAEVEGVSVDSRRIVLQLLDADHRLAVPLGGHVSVCVPDAAVERAYSPTVVDAGRFELVVKRYAGGRGSSYMHSLQVGDAVKIRGPLAPLDDVECHLAAGDDSLLVPKRVLLLGGGSGVAPLLGIARHIAQLPPTESAGNPTVVATAILSFRTREEELLVERFRQLAEAHPARVALHVNYTREAAPALEIPGEHFGPLGGATLNAIVGSPALRDGVDSAVICGPPGYNQSVPKLLQGLGLSPRSMAVL